MKKTNQYKVNQFKWIQLIIDRDFIKDINEIQTEYGMPYKKDGKILDFSNSCQNLLKLSDKRLFPFIERVINLSKKYEFDNNWNAILMRHIISDEDLTFPPYNFSLKIVNGLPAIILTKTTSRNDLIDAAGEIQDFRDKVFKNQLKMKRRRFSPEIVKRTLNAKLILNEAKRTNLMSAMVNATLNDETMTKKKELKMIRNLRVRKTRSKKKNFTK
jgi:hypothetical protein